MLALQVISNIAIILALEGLVTYIAEGTGPFRGWLADFFLDWNVHPDLLCGLLVNVLKVGVEVPSTGVQLVGKIARIITQRAQPGLVEHSVYLVLMNR